MLKVTYQDQSPAGVLKKCENFRNFPCSSVIETSLLHCRGQGFDPWSGNSDLTCHVAQPKRINKKKKPSAGISLFKNMKIMIQIHTS